MTVIGSNVSVGIVFSN